jgi:hypothetical protein
LKKFYKSFFKTIVFCGPNITSIQFDETEKNDEYNLCYHDVLILNSNGDFSNDFINKTNKLVTTKYDLAVWGNFIHTSSVVVRNNKFLEK